LQRFVRELQLLAGDLRENDPYELGLRLVNAVALLPSDNGPLTWWTVRGLTTEACVRLCRQGGWDWNELELRRSVSASSSPCELADLILRHVQACSGRAERRDRGLDTRIDRAVIYIRANCTRPSLVVEDVARHVRLSRWHLSRLLVRYLGAPYRDVLRRIRVAEARRLLRDDALSVKEVAVRVGYPHATELDRAFKHCFGVTPTEWRTRRGSRESRRAADTPVIGSRQADHRDRSAPHRAAPIRSRSTRPPQDS
jgi:AraC-like DNA-binding protein